MVTAFSVCLMPVIISCVLEGLFVDNLLPMTNFLQFNKSLTQRISRMGLISGILLISNSSMNGVIYSWMSWRFRAEAKHFVFRLGTVHGKRIHMNFNFLEFYCGTRTTTLHVHLQQPERRRRTTFLLHLESRGTMKTSITSTNR